MSTTATLVNRLNQLQNTWKDALARDKNSEIRELIPRVLTSICDIFRGDDRKELSQEELLALTEKVSRLEDEIVQYAYGKKGNRRAEGLFDFIPISCGDDVTVKDRNDGTQLFQYFSANPVRVDIVKFGG
ncbi:hypothetical protein VNI00_012662 [Paramarasmius palmivorus]|uniref:Uncharacterized protein n=1 Tax=Paramarasmius palmivorus TaxID=297713 RepID=A0AAW0C470_9AGAR